MSLRSLYPKIKDVLGAFLKAVRPQDVITSLVGGRPWHLIHEYLLEVSKEIPQRAPPPPEAFSLLTDYAVGICLYALNCCEKKEFKEAFNTLEGYHLYLIEKQFGDVFDGRLSQLEALIT
jgi:hypothetical protein